MALIKINPNTLFNVTDHISEDARKKLKQAQKKRNRFEQKYAWAATTIHNKKLFRFFNWKADETERRLFGFNMACLDLEQKAKTRYTKLRQTEYFWNEIVKHICYLKTVSQAAIKSEKDFLLFTDEDLTKAYYVKREYSVMEEITG